MTAPIAKPMPDAATYHTPNTFKSSVYTANAISVFDTPTIPNFTNCKTKGILRIRGALVPYSSHGHDLTSFVPAKGNMPDTAARVPALLSVVAPVYNEEELVEAFVKRACAAVADYTFELVLVNDGSSDSTPALLDRLAAADPRVRVDPSLA